MGNMIFINRQKCLFFFLIFIKNFDIINYKEKGE